MRIPFYKLEPGDLFIRSEQLYAVDTTRITEAWCFDANLTVKMRPFVLCELAELVEISPYEEETVD